MSRHDPETGKADFEAIYDLYYDRIFNYSYSLLLNREDAEDVTSETFLSAYYYFDRYDAQKASVATWLTRIAHNNAVNLRRSAAYRKRADLPGEAASESFTEQVEAAQTVGWLFLQLSTEERELLTMRCVMELSDAEIGKLTGLEPKTVNKRYHRLLDRCRRLLDGETAG